ncbi:type II toxin-antitoxin system RelE/ParE family toxin [Halomicrobium sp. HM KBTZ05]|uniref:Type II toxin-antitoxin system RelE/ParE family toxin n=1 Tax=Halomicrobium mukohataei TaxID=57705 RepID=A0A847UCC7_9EURY|nr:type II toxin-antitoxin system RelE/ParE family toxin [Halomicrobium mukohataei]NLV09867.1 type II toxin-antitoxin system RelE/ParE family toxin [Halomicrobium mukohataei]
MDQTTSDDDWDWEFSPRAENQFSQLGSDSQQRIIDKLEEVVSSEWRDPDDFLEPLTGSPFQKLRVGGYRLGCRLLHESKMLRVESVRKREGAYKGDDD